MTILVLDIGSSSARALLFDHAAQPIPGALVNRPYTFTYTPTGAAVIDARDLQMHIETCIDQILTHPAAASIDAVGIDTFVGNVLGVDSRGSALTPIYSYADTRSAEDVELLRQRIDERAAHQRTGCLLHTAYQPARLHWLRRTQSHLFASVRQWVDIGAYLYRRWFGQSVCSYSAASWSGMLNRATLNWDDDWLSMLQMDNSAFPRLVDVDAPVSGLLPDYAERWRVLRDVPFCPAIGDGAAANVGSGCVDRAHIALTIGTTAALRTITDATLPDVPDGLWSYRVDAAHHLIGGATSEGGNIFKWAQDTLRLPDSATLEAALATREPDSHGLTFLPLLAGERSPGWSVDATGTIHGLRLSTTPLDIVQAAYEGVALRLALIAEQLAHVTDTHPKFIASGGSLASSEVWARIIANALDQPLHIINQTELTARGTALIVLRALGNPVESNATFERSVEPNSQRVSILRAARERQVNLYHKLVLER